VFKTRKQFRKPEDRERPPLKAVTRGLVKAVTEGSSMCVTVMCKMWPRVVC
jgi:hypothetical protein